MGGSGWMSFGGGFTQGLSGILQQHRQQEREDERIANDRMFRENAFLFPHVFEQDLAAGDFTRSEELIAAMSPRLAKQIKKQSPFQQLGPLLQHAAGQGGGIVSQADGERYGAILQREKDTGAIGTQSRPTTPQEQMSMPGAPATMEVPPERPLLQPTRVAGVPPPPAPTFMGRPMLTTEQRIEQAGRSTRSEAKNRTLGGIQGQQDAADELIRNGMSREEAYDRVGLEQRSVGRTTTGSFGDFLLRKQSEVGRTLTTTEVATLRKDWESLNDQNRAGTALEGAAQLAGFAKFSEVPPERREEVRKVAEQFAKTFRESGSYGAGLGSGKADMEKPADLATAQATGVNVGTTAAQVSGQAVPTQELQQQVRGLATTKTLLEQIVKDNLLAVLPKKADLGGLAPGASLALKRVTQREEVAKLESAIDGVVNELARYRGQRGAQTEQDVERAYNALVQMKAGLFSPTAGDTQESAKARFDQTLQALDTVIGSLPKAPTPTAKTGAAGGTALPNGFTIGPDGKLYTTRPPK